jgi:asparagine synthetase B (glutamine-hydrolysing)
MGDYDLPDLGKDVYDQPIMCGFIATNKRVDRVDQANFFVQKRGPDLTNQIVYNDFAFVHDLLSITGEFTPQPFMDKESGIVAMFNGQIYNYLEFGDYASDGESLIPLYKKYGEDFIRKLDGEFAIVLFDFQKKLFIATSDVFATKPIWYAVEEGAIGLASYQSALESLGFGSTQKIPANTTYVFDLEHAKLLRTKTVFDFDVRQYKTDLGDFFTAFEGAVEKRTRNLREKIFIGLSSGHDSGALALAMTRLGVHFEAYSIEGREDKNTLTARHKLLTYPPHLLQLDYQSFLKAKLYLRLNAEEHCMEINPAHKNHFVTNDPGAIGLSYICSIAQSEGVKIYLSGQGADEIISDYGMKGKALATHSTFKGIFPDRLESHFPWYDFYKGAQADYLAKEENVSGSYGIEGRYPFLDKYFVQEFLWLDVTLKNKDYKYPLAAYLEKYAYPFQKDFKRGFVLGKFSWWQRLDPRNLLTVLMFLLRKMSNKLA